ncbi:MAG: PIN domain-containing protein [Gallionellaceae bacterium]|nr:PIN domain-containing protein [Gallionellaceae bacterium]
MPAAEFLDSNVVIYAYGNDMRKKACALDLLATTPTVSTQVFNETVSVLRRKNMLADNRLDSVVNDLAAYLTVVQVELVTIKRAVALMIKHQLSYYDALIVATALEAGCTTLYSEDLQHGQVFDGSLRVINPFLS